MSVPPQSNDDAARDMMRHLREDPSFYEDAAAGHLDDAAMASFVAGAAGERHEKMVTHLAGCARCRHAVAALSTTLSAPAVAREVSRLGSMSARRWAAWTAAALATAATILLIVNPFRGTPAPGGTVFRGNSEGAAPLTLIGPVAGTVVRTDSLIFAWHGLGAQVEYRITVTDDKGDVVWTRQSPDTEARPPAALLRPGQSYFWYVDALLPNGRSTAAGVERFRMGP